VKITVERCDKIMVAVSQIFDRVKSVALWSANIRKLAKDHKGYSSTAIILYEKHDEDFILLTRKLNKDTQKVFFIRHFHFFAFCLANSVCDCDIHVNLPAVAFFCRF
jgi:hypothetical protein